MATRIITTTTADYIARWFEAAINDSSVRPFLSFGQWHGAPEVGDGTWHRLLIGDSYGAGLTRIEFDRNMGWVDAAVSLWVLACPERKNIAAQHMLAIKKALKNFSVRWAQAAVHEVNADCSALMEKHFGSPLYRIEENALADGKPCASLHWRVRV